MAGETPTPAPTPRPRPEWRGRAVRYPAGRGVGLGTVLEQTDNHLQIRTANGKVVKRSWDNVHLADDQEQPKQ